MESRYERARAKIAESYTDMNDQIAGGRSETKPFTARRNNMVLSTLFCGISSN